MRTLSVSVVCAALSRQVAFVVDDEMILIQMLVFREIWTRVKLDPGRVRAKPITHDEVTDAAKEISARNFGAGTVGRISGSYIWIVPEKLRYRDAPFRLRGPAALVQQPRGVRVFEAVDCVTKADVVFPLEVRKLVIVIPCRRTIRQNLVEIRIGVMLKEGVTQRRIAVRRCAQQFRHHCEWRKG